MTAFKTILAGGVAIAALASAAPAAAQYPGYGYGSGGGAGIIGQVINSVIGGGYGSSYGNSYGNGYGYNGYNNSYGQNPYSRYGQMGQMAINQCMGAVQQRLSANYGYGNNGYSNGYNNGYSNGYGYNGAQQQQPYGQQYGGARVLGISDIDQRSNGGLSIRGVANSGRNSGYGYGGGYSGGYSSQGQGQVDLTFRCKTDASGYIVDVDIEQATSAYGYSNSRAYTPYNYDYSQYGYRRY